MLSRLLGHTFKGVVMDQKQWDKLNKVERLRYALLNKDKFSLVVDNNTIQLESIDPLEIEDNNDYGVDGLLTALNIPYEVA